MKTQSISRSRRSFFSTSTWRFALVASLVFGVALLVGYTATATAPALINRIAQMSGSEARSAEQSRYVQPSTHRTEHILTVPVTLEPVVFTDRPNYFPGETALITGLGFWPNEVITLQVIHIDDTAEGGAGHAPWSVSADAFGNFESSWFVDPDDSGGSMFKLVATGSSSGLVAETTFTDGSANLDSCANGPASSPAFCAGDNWDNGNLNASKSHYGEGDSVPFRTILENLTAGNTYKLTIEYDTTQGGKHAFDYLTSFDRTEPTPGNNPCTRKVGGSIVSVCDPLTGITTPIPTDQNVSNGQNGAPGGGDDIVQIPGVFTLFNGTAFSVLNPGSEYTLSGSYAGNSSTSITVQFTASSTIAVIAWGGHIATRLNWGLANSAIAIDGSPYHMRLTNIVCSGQGEQCNVGNQDHQLSASAVFFPIQLTIIKETNPDNAQSKQFNYTTTGNNLNSFSLTPPNGTTPAQTQFNLTDATARSVTESDPSAATPKFNLTSLTCSQTDGGLGVGTFSTSLGTRTVNFTPKEGQFISCTFVNEQVLGNIVVDKVTVPGGDATSFDFTTTYGSPFSLTDGATPNDSGPLVPGTYQVSETANANYDTTSTCTSSLGHPADNPNSINLDAGETVTCTFTNTKKPKLTVNKVVVNDNGGQKQISDFPLFVDGNSVTSGAKNTQTIGSHTVSETSDPGYTSTIGGDCAADGSITLAAGDDKTCTITNNDKAAKLTVIKHVINDNGGTATAANFTLDSGGSNDSPDNFAGAESPGTDVTLDAGSYNVTESGPSGYTASYSADCSGSIANGESKTCTVTNNDQPAKLIVIKHVINDNGGTATAANFSLDSGGANDSPDNFPGAESPGTNVTLDAGSYNVTETGPSGYTASYSADCSGTIASGQEKTCTVTNDDQPGKLIVIKHVINDNGGTAVAANFTLDSGGSNDSPDNFPGAESPGTQVTLDAGSYNVTETGPSGYTASFSADCSGSIANGQEKTCTVTNNDQPAKLIVIKHVINNNGGTAVAADFTLDSGGSNDSPDNFPGAESPGTEVALDAGSYNVTEQGPSGYTASFSAYCSGTIANGQTKTCTVTNDDQPAKLIVIKHVVNDNGGTAVAADFSLDSGGANDTPDNFPGAESPGTQVTLDAGSYNVTETGPSGYTASYSADCSGTIANGQEKTCTVTNDDQAAKLIVIKHVINNNGGAAVAADFTLDSGGSNDSPDNFAGAESPGTEVTLDAGSYNVTESGPSGYTASFSAYCSGTIANGQTKTCTVTNDDKPAKLIVIKHVINDNGGTATAANFTLDSGGANDSPDDFPGAESPGTQVTLNAGSYNVTESGPAGYAASFSADCSGSIANGQYKTCTVTNNDIAPTLKVIKDLVPDTDGGLFNLRIDGVTPVGGANVGDGGTTGFVQVNAGNHVVSETGGTNTSLSDYVSVIGGDCAANGTVSLALAQNKTCTITNTRKGKAAVVKTVSGQPPPAGQSFTFELRQGASTGSDGTVLETKNTDSSGNISFTTSLIPGDTYQICEWVFPGWNTNLAGDGPLFVPNSIIPPALPNPNVNNLTVCADFTVQPGQTRSFTVNNTPPPGGRALTIGFWKNWASCSNSNGKGQKPMLDLALGFASATTTNPPGGLVGSAQNPGAAGWPNYAASWYLVLKGNPASTANNILPAPDCTRTVNLLNKSTTDGKKKMSSDPLFNLTAQLIAAELNRFMGAGISGTTIVNIDRAVLLNGKYKFDGLTYTPKLTTADSNIANCLATQLDNYNNGRPVAMCP